MDKFVIGTIIATVLILGGIIYFGSSNAPKIATPKDIENAELIRDHSEILGSKSETAKYTIVEFGDFQCPACASAHPHLKQLLTAYGDDLKFVFRNLPLNNIHPHADLGARAAIAASRQGKFEEMNNMLFERQSDWSTKLDPIKTLVKYAEEIGLDKNQFNSDLRSEETTDIIATDLGDAEALGLSSTPTFYINGERYAGSATFDAMKAYLDSLK